MAPGATRPSLPESKHDSPAGCLLRLYWMFGGNIALVVLALYISQSAGWSVADLAYWLTASLLIAARYIDIARFGGTTIELEPATKAHFKRYALVVVLGSAGVFAVARMLGPGFP